MPVKTEMSELCAVFFYIKVHSPSSDSYLGCSRSHRASTAPTLNRRGAPPGGARHHARPHWAAGMGAGQGQRISKPGPALEAPAHPRRSPETHSVHLTALCPLQDPAGCHGLPEISQGGRLGKASSLGAPSLRGPVHTVSHCFLLRGRWTGSPQAGPGLGRPGPLGNCFQVSESGSGEPHAAFLGHCPQPCLGPGGHGRSVTGLPPVLSVLCLDPLRTPIPLEAQDWPSQPAGGTHSQFVTITKCSDVESQ